MKILKLVFFITFFQRFRLQDDAKYKNFFQITAENIEKFQKKWDLNFIYLHSEENCGFCKLALKTLSELAKKYNDSYSSRNRFGIAICEKSLICNKFSTKKTPVLLYKIKNEFITFNKTFTKDNINDFVLQKINKEPIIYNEKKFDSIISQNNVKFQVTALYKGNYDLKDPDFLTFYDLSKRENVDQFYYCQDNVKCLELFKDNEDEDLLLFFQSRKKYQKLNKDIKFKTLVHEFNKFKNPFFLDFGIEFKKKVLQDMIPTIIYIIDNKEKEDQIELFQTTIKMYKNHMQACLIRKDELSVDQEQIYEELDLILGPESYQLPLVVFLEPNFDTMRLNQYRFDGNNIRYLKSYLEQMFKGALTPYRKSEKLENELYEEFNIINADNFKNKVFVKGQESIVFIHEGYIKENDNSKNQKYWNFLKKLKGISRFNSLKFFVINGQKNELPIYYEQLPSLHLYTEDQWDFPLTYFKDDVDKFIGVIDQRKELIIKSSEDFNIEDMKNLFTEL